MAIPVVGNLWQIVRRVDTLFEDVGKLIKGLDAVREELVPLNRRVTVLELREDLLVEKTRTAAATAASSAVTIHLVDMSRRIGVLEAGQRRLD